MSTRKGRWFPVSLAAKIVGVPARTMRHHVETVLASTPDARRAPALTRPTSKRSRAGCTHWEVSGAFLDRFIETMGAQRGGEVASRHCASADDDG